MNPNEAINNSASLEDNLKKALTELLVLQLLSERDYYIGELTSTLKHRSNNTLNIVFPYGAVYRLQQSEYIAEGQKRIAPDGRRRQYYSITPKGLQYLDLLRSIYCRFIQGVETVLKSSEV